MAVGARVEFLPGSPTLGFRKPDLPVTGEFISNFDRRPGLFIRRTVCHLARHGDKTHIQHLILRNLAVPLP